MTLQETAKHFRRRLRHEGIAARCTGSVSCGKQYIRVSQPKSEETSFTDEQQKTIQVIAYGCQLTKADYTPIDIENLALTYSKSATFILPVAA